jgi:hypothetical protein
MASTSTNKQPLMVDRPFFRGARINNSTPVVTSPSNPDFSQLVQLVRVGDLPSEDGALVEDIFVVSSEGYPDRSGVRTAAFGVYVYAPNQAAPSTSTPLLVGKFQVGLSGSTDGLIQRVELPATVAPTPQVGDTTTVYPIERGKSEAMYLEKGYILCVGYLGNGPAAVSGGLSASGVCIMAQGGFY